jgi:hypothetical protein
MKKGGFMNYKDLEGAAVGVVSVARKDKRVHLKVNDHEVTSFTESEFFDLCGCCTSFGQTLLQERELELKKKLLKYGK